MACTCTWETPESQVQKQSLDKLLESFFFAEQVRWLESSSPLQRNYMSLTSCSYCSKSSSQDGDRCSKLDPGIQILRHAKNINSIHAYFQNLEPHRYRLKLTARSKVLDQPDSSMRLVGSDSRLDSNPPSNPNEAAAGFEHTTLTDQEWQLYEMVVKCYRSPYLTAPPAPSPYSPSSSPTSGLQQQGFDDFSYSPPPRAHIHSPFTSRWFSFQSESSPDPIPPVNITMMRELVRKTFGLTKVLHASREKMIKEKMLPKNADRVLVEDLLTQMYYLNNNCHPYYHMQSFMDSSSYDEWITAEKENITRRIKVFWNFPLPPCPSAYPLSQPDAHKGYLTLMEKFIRCESSNKENHSMFGDATPTGPLSPAALRILKEYGLRYGVGELYRKLVYLKYLVKHFESKLWYFQHAGTHLEDVMNLVTMTPEVYVKEVFVMLLQVLTLFLRLSKYYLTRVMRLFPNNSPPEGIKSLVTMAKLSQDAAIYLRANFSSAFTAVMLREVVKEFTDSLIDEPFEILLARYLQEEVEGRYERFKVIAADKLKVDCYEVTLTPHVLNILIYDIQEEITLYKTDYQSEFQEYVDLVKLATVKLYELLMIDVREMFLHIPEDVRREKVDLRMLALGYRLSILDKDLANNLTLDMQTWREPFLQLSLDWLNIVGGHQKRLISTLLDKDSWHAVEVTVQRKNTKPKGVLTNKVLKISRQQLFTRSENSAFSQVRSESESASKAIPQDQGRAASHPSLARNLVQSSAQRSSSSNDSIETQNRTTQFEGKHIVTTALIHIPKHTDTSPKSDGGLSRSCPIEDIHPIEISTDSSGLKIEDIDKSGEYERAMEGSEKETRFHHERPVFGFSSLAADNDQTSQTRQASPTGTKHGTQSHSATTTQESASNQPDHDDRATPYENIDTSSDYMTAESSPSRSDQISETSPSSDVVNDMTHVDRRLWDIDSLTTSDVEHVSPQVCLKAADTVGPTVEVGIDDSKAPVPSGQNNHQLRNGAKECCDNCPNKASKIVPDIEDAPVSDDITDNNPVKADISEEEWNKPGPSGLQRPVALANKHLSKALKSEVTSLSDGATEYGSVPSRVTLASYETAHYSSNSNIKSSDFESTFTTSYESMTDESATKDDSDVPPQTEVLPMSSSVVDLLCSVNRLTAFICHLCAILCPNEPIDRCPDADEVRSKTLHIKTALCGRLIQIVKEMIVLYSESLLAVETCGMSERELSDVIGERLARNLFDQYSQGIVGCRLNPGRQTRCNAPNSAGKIVKPCAALTKLKIGPTGCEGATSKMGLRSSDVIVLNSLLSWLHDRMTLNVTCHNSMGARFHDNRGDCEVISHLSEAYCQNGPSVDSKRKDFQQECQRRHGDESRILSQSIDESLDECGGRLNQILDIQCKLLAYRLNDIFKSIFHQLLSLFLPTFDTKKRLQPIIDFLLKRLTSLRKVMFPESFMVTVEYLWQHVTQEISEEVELVKERRERAPDQAVLLLNSMAHLMQFFHGQGKGLSFDFLISSTEAVTKHIELYATPTEKLVRLYQWLAAQMLNIRKEQLRNVDQEFTSSVSTSSHQSRAHTPADHLIQSLRLGLHSIRKCFSGSDFVEWVRDYVKQHGYDSLGVCIGITDTETGIELGQYLLERKLLTNVTGIGCPVYLTESDESVEACAKTTRSRASKGTVFMKDSTTLPSQMRFNEISISKGVTTTASQHSTNSSSRPGTETSELHESSESLQSEDLDRQELLDSVDVILRHAQSDQSLLQFQDSPDVFYTFISDDDGSGGTFKYKLDLTDRFSIRAKLEQIVCVLYARKRKDAEAKRFLKKLPKDFIAQAIGYKDTPLCFHI